MALRIAHVVKSLRDASLRKPPSVSESIDWARTLLALGIEDVDDSVTAQTINVLLKYQSDIDAVAVELGLDE